MTNTNKKAEINDILLIDVVYNTNTEESEH